MNNWPFVGYIVGVIAFAFLVKYIVKFVIKYFHKAKFYASFNYEPEPENDLELHNLQSREVVVPRLKTLAHILDGTYNEETQLLHTIKYSESNSVDYEKTKSKIIKIRKDKKNYERSFYDGLHIAQYFGFSVPDDFKYYIK